MSIEKLLAFVLGPAILLIIIVVMIFVEKPKKKEPQIDMKKLSETDKKLFEDQKNKIDQLNIKITDIINQFSQRDTVIDSLAKLLSRKEIDYESNELEIEKLNNQLSEKNELENKATELENKAIELAKTFSGMKTRQMSPILQKLNDKTVTLIYNNMNKRDRKKFILALSTQRAASLIQKMASLN